MKHKLLHGLLLTATLVITGCNAVSSAAKPESLMKTESAFTVEETANKLNAIIQSKGLTVFTRINHAENAAKAGLDLRPTELIIFGNPKVGTPLMQCAQTTAIDLPQKMLVWQDEEKKVWVSYNTPEYLKQRHNIEGCDKVLGKVKNVLGALSKAATSK